MIFKDNVKWPCIYHLRLLAFTSQWRTKENLRLVDKAIEHLFNILPFGVSRIYIKEGNQLIAPCGELLDNLIVDFSEKDNKNVFLWFRYMELLSRIGVVKNINWLQEQVKELEKHLRCNEGKYVKGSSHYCFKKWSAYTGLAIEENWKSSKKRQCDFTFRCLLILHYSNLNNKSQ